MPRPNGSGRINRLDDAEFAKTVAELYVAGTSSTEMAAELACHKDTIRLWVKDPRVRAHIRMQAKERVDRISRRIDGEIEARLAHVGDWEIDQLLKVRKEYLDRPLKLMQDGGTDEATASNEIAEAMDENPDFAAELLKVLESKGKKALPAPQE
jgi:hypothetical protein